MGCRGASSEKRRDSHMRPFSLARTSFDSESEDSSTGRGAFPSPILLLKTSFSPPISRHVLPASLPFSSDRPLPTVRFAPDLSFGVEWQVFSLFRSWWRERRGTSKRTFMCHFTPRRMRRTTRMLRRLLHLRARESRNRRDRVEEQDLRDVRVREVYRTRSKEEVELAEWEGNDGHETERSTHRDTDEEKDGVSTTETPMRVAWVRPARTKRRNQRRGEHTLAFQKTWEPLCVRFLVASATANGRRHSCKDVRVVNSCLQEGTQALRCKMI